VKLKRKLIQPKDKKKNNQKNEDQNLNKK
jgi:hypothetical protein